MVRIMVIIYNNHDGANHCQKGYILQDNKDDNNNNNNDNDNDNNNRLHHSIRKFILMASHYDTCFDNNTSRYNVYTSIYA